MAKIKGPRSVKLKELVTKNSRRGKGVKVRISCSSISCSLDCIATVSNNIWGRYGVGLKFWKSGKKATGKRKVLSQRKIKLKAGETKTIRLKGISTPRKRKLVREAARKKPYKRIKMKYVIDAKAVGGAGQRGYSSATARVRLSY